MKDFKKFLWASLAKYRLANIWRWAFINSVFEKYIEENMKIKINIQWKLEYDIYFVKLSNSSLANQLFLNKNYIKEYINKRLESMHFNIIKDIKFI